MGLYSQLRKKEKMIEERYLRDDIQLSDLIKDKSVILNVLLKETLEEKDIEELLSTYKQRSDQEKPDIYKINYRGKYVSGTPLIILVDRQKFEWFRYLKRHPQHNHIALGESLLYKSGVDFFFRGEFFGNGKIFEYLQPESIGSIVLPDTVLYYTKLFGQEYTVHKNTEMLYDSGHDEPLVFDRHIRPAICPRPMKKEDKNENIR